MGITKETPIKIVTFSFDDGVNNDIRLVKLLNKYGFKATFNLNSGKMFHEDNWVFEGDIVYHLYEQEALSLYNGHEIASHGYHHINIDDAKDLSVIDEEITFDILNLAKLFHTKINGFVIPYGETKKDIDPILIINNIKWVRGVKNTYNFDVPDNLLHYQPTIRITDPRLDEIVDEFIKLKPTKKQVLYIWSHSYEFNTEEKWHHFEEILKKLNSQKDIFKLTNSDALL